MKEKTNTRRKMGANGITLIALIITIIVMLILVAVTISVALNGGLISKSQEAKTKTEYQEDREMLLSSVVGAINNDAEVDYGKLDSNLPVGFTKAEDGGYTSKSGNTYYVTKNGSITDEKPKEEGIQVTEGGVSKTITASNVAEFLGKKVTNYTGKSQVTIGSSTYTVSPEYRLYYVDFAGKYGEKNTIYLKAECTNETYDIPTTNPGEDDIVKIKELNPGLYSQEDKNGMPIPGSSQTPPDESQDNMKAVTWLTNTNNWGGLKPETYKNGISEMNINYIVGAPSLEMMMDSYNTHYELTGDTPDTSLLNASSNRVKLFYQYPYSGDNNKYGYGVGPCRDSSENHEYYTYTSDYSVKTDDIDSMYYPGSGNHYWLASPSADGMVGPLCVMYVRSENSGKVSLDVYFAPYYAFCPIVSLKSTVNLTLE